MSVLPLPKGISLCRKIHRQTTFSRTLADHYNGKTTGRGTALARGSCILFDIYVSLYKKTVGFNLSFGMLVPESYYGHSDRL